MSPALDALPAEQRRLLRPGRQPNRFEPMKATLSREAFTREGWLFERKLDGVRCIAARQGDRVQLSSRTWHSMNNAYPEIVAALGDERCEEFVIDGEVVAFEGRVTSFAKLQGRMQRSDSNAAASTGIKVFFYVFDVVHLDGYDTTPLPLRARKAMLRAALSFGGAVRFVTHRNTAGEAFFEQACAQGLEGIVGKRADSAYEFRRSKDWLKFKCIAEQELVIGGYTAPKGSRTDFGALLVGYYEDGRLRYAGKVGTGFAHQTLSSLGSRLRELEVERPSFDEPVTPRPAGTHWVEPELVAQVGFAEWTREGRLRQPRYLGLRDDKAASDVVRERPR